MEISETSGADSAQEPKSDENSCKVWVDQGRWYCKLPCSEDIYWSHIEDRVRAFEAKVGDDKHKIARYKVQFKIRIKLPKRA